LDTFANIAPGCSISLQPICLLFCFIGVALGAIVGILPGLGSAATIALPLPITYFLDTATAIIMLSGIWYGSMYDGSITSILLRVPGESTARERRDGADARHLHAARGDVGSHAYDPASRDVLGDRHQHVRRQLHVRSIGIVCLQSAGHSSSPPSTNNKAAR